MENQGILSLIQLSDDEKELFLDYMCALKDTEQYDILVNLFGKDLLKFMDVFSGQSIKIPTRKYINKVIKYIKIYKYCEARGFSDESYRKAGKIFDRRKSSVIRAVKKVERVINKLEVDSDEEAFESGRGDESDEGK